jgi:hypothetical protein
MFLQIAFGANDPLGGLLRLADGLAEAFNLFVDVFHCLGAFVQAGETASELIDLAERDCGGFLDLLERLVRLRELRGAHRHLREHLAQRAPLFPGGVD